jgi:methyl-accepting chemotaxis protein
MPSDVTVDPQDLNNFATDVRKLVNSLTMAKPNWSSLVAVDKPVKFGQDVVFPASLNVSSTSSPIAMFRSHLSQSITDFGDNFQTLINKLNLIADTADAIAKNYRDAADLDSMSADAVKSMLSTIDSTPTTSGTTTGL